MTAAKVMDVIARCLDCDGQAADAVSSGTMTRKESIFCIIDGHTSHDQNDN